MTHFQTEAEQMFYAWKEVLRVIEDKVYGDRRKDRGWAYLSRTDSVRFYHIDKEGDVIVSISPSFPLSTPWNVDNISIFVDHKQIVTISIPLNINTPESLSHYVNKKLVKYKNK